MPLSPEFTELLLNTIPEHLTSDHSKSVASREWMIRALTKTLTVINTNPADIGNLIIAITSRLQATNSGRHGSAIGTLGVYHLYSTISHTIMLAHLARASA